MWSIKRWYQQLPPKMSLGWLVLPVAWAVLCTALLVWLMMAQFSQTSSWDHKLVVPGDKWISLPKSGPYVLYHEYRSYQGDQVYESDQLDVSQFVAYLKRNEDDTPLYVKPLKAQMNYNAGGRIRAYSIGQVHLDQPGLYHLEVKLRPGQESSSLSPAVFNLVPQWDLFKVLFPAIGLYFVFGLFLSFVAAIVILVKRFS